MSKLIFDENQKRDFASKVIKSTIGCVNNINKYVDDYVTDNLESMVIAILGLENRYNETKISRVNGFTGLLSTLVHSRAQKKATQDAEVVLQKLKNSLNEIFFDKSLIQEIEREYEYSYRTHFKKLISHAEIEVQNKRQKIVDEFIEDTVKELNGPLAQKILKEFGELEKCSGKI